LARNAGSDRNQRRMMIGFRGKSVMRIRREQ
jgi:hypothetical protein